MGTETDNLREALKKGAAALLKAAPLWVEAIAAGAFIASVVDGKPLLKERLKELDGKVFLFEAGDIGKRFHLVIKGSEVKIVPHVPMPPDVTMKGDAALLLDLFLGKVDPDTVFFSRKLEISGDTAAAIHLKNVLASAL